MTEQQNAQACKRPRSGHLIGYLAEQPLHPGTGQALGAIDQPVAREGGSHIPVIPGSSHKGSVKHAITGGSEKCDFWSLFGGTDEEGGVLFSDIRLLLLPIRSSVDSYKWATCPYLLERLARDLTRTRRTAGFEVPAVGDGQVLTAGKNSERFYLEELTFTIAGAVDEKIRCGVGTFIPAEQPYAKVSARLEKQLLIMSDDDFAWFARYGLPIYARNKLKENTKSSENLWYEEHLPADTLMYGIVAPRSETTKKYGENNEKGREGRSYDDFIERLKGDKGKKIDPLCYLQIGGDETVGRGICRVHVVGD